MRFYAALNFKSCLPSSSEPYVSRQLQSKRHIFSETEKRAEKRSEKLSQLKSRSRRLTYEM